MSICIFWLELDSGNGELTACHRVFGDKEFNPALSFCKEIRTQTDRPEVVVSHVTMSTELSDMVGKAGVDSVENGKTPDGVEYSWTKRRSTALRSEQPLKALPVKT